MRANPCSLEARKLVQSDSNSTRFADAHEEQRSRAASSCVPPSPVRATSVSARRPTIVVSVAVGRGKRREVCSRNANILTRPPPVRQDAPLTSQKALARANGTSRRANGWAGEKDARSESITVALVIFPAAVSGERVRRRLSNFPARGTRTIRMCSFDARNRGSTRLPLKVK